jgi:folate-binding protein YgfZ
MPEAASFDRPQEIENLIGSSSAIVQLEGVGPLLLTGDTKQEYLQRQTSNNLDLLAEGKAIGNLLPNANGRLLEIFTHFTHDGGIAILTQAHRAKGVHDFFSRRIFFNDQVELIDQSSNWAVHWLIESAEATDDAEQQLRKQLPSPGDIRSIEIENHKMMAIRLADILAAEERRNYLLLRQDPSLTYSKFIRGLGRIELSNQSLDAIGVLRGDPGEFELSGRYTPFELGLDNLVSGDKGCYTGQEVLARQVTYDKVGRSRFLLLSSTELEAGDLIIHAKQQIGAAGSAFQMQDGQWVSLGVMKNSALKLLDEVTIRGENETNTAKIVHNFTPVAEIQG